ncbi:MAG: glycosyltransferase family 4 protein [Phycisphaerae bacterium]|nr:glycosyltransferase family 4 protein [Phycisphaerae bacterium]
MTLRVRVVHPLIAKYREPVFAELARRPGIDLEVWADLRAKTGSLKGLPGSDFFRCVQAPYRELGPILWQPTMMAAVTGPVDAVILPWNSRYVHLVPALRRARRNGVRAVLFGHGIGKRESVLRRRIRNAIFSLADACVLYSPGQAAALIAEGKPKGRIFVAPNSLDPAPIDAARAMWDTARTDAFLAERGCARGELIVTVSRLERWKRVDRLLEAFALIAARRPAARLAIIGDGPDRAALELQATQTGFRDRVHFTGALYDEIAIAPWMLGSACLAFPAAIGLSLLHAFLYGLPVVTSDDRLPHGPEIEALQDGLNGLLYREGDTAHFAAQIERLLGDSAEQRRLAGKAQATVSCPGGWNIRTMVDGFVAAVGGGVGS